MGQARLRQLNPSAPVPSNAVVLGGQEFRIRLDRSHTENLKALAFMFGHKSVTEYAELLLRTTVENVANTVATSMAVTRTLLALPL